MKRPLLPGAERIRPSFFHAPVKYENALYSVSPDGKATLQNVSATGWNGTVSAAVGGFPVAAIESIEAYYDDGIDIGGPVGGTTTVTIPGSVTYIASSAFWPIKSLTAINVASDNPVYYSIDGVLFSNIYFEEPYKTLHSYPSVKKGSRYVIPDGTRRMDDFFIAPDSTGLKELMIPSSLEMEWYQDRVFHK